MNNIYYIGYYCGDNTGSRKIENTNYAGTLKMKFIINCLKKIGMNIIVVSVAPDSLCGYRGIEEIQIDDKEKDVYLPSFSFKIKGKKHGGRISNVFLKDYILKHVDMNDVVISYHSLRYGELLDELHNKIGFKWLPQVEEIYCLSRGEYQNPSILEKEEKMFINGDGFLFVNDILPSKYSNGKPYAVSYGNYEVFSEKTKKESGIINLTYTGIINDDRGAFLLLDAMRLLPSVYHLNVLGFGTDENMSRFISKIEILNTEFGSERIKYCGTRSGKEYSDFLINNQIGISLMDESDNISLNAFPSKIMAYLGHSLYVVSSRTKSIECSKVSKYLYLCDNNPDSIARVIQSIDLNKENKTKSILNNLENTFIRELRGLIRK